MKNTIFAILGAVAISTATAFVVRKAIQIQLAKQQEEMIDILEESE